jgi:hypothetical protein
MLDRRRWLPDSGSSHGFLSGLASAEHILFGDKLTATPLSSEAGNYTLDQKLARPRTTIDCITAGLALLGSRTDISSSPSREAFRERLSELSSKVHETSTFSAPSLYRRVAIAVARATLLRLPPMWFVSRSAKLTLGSVRLRFRRFKSGTCNHLKLLFQAVA